MDEINTTSAPIGDNVVDTDTNPDLNTLGETVEVVGTNDPTIATDTTEGGNTTMYIVGAIIIVVIIAAIVYFAKKN